MYDIMHINVVVLFGRRIITQFEIKPEKFEKKNESGGSVTAPCMYNAIRHTNNLLHLSTTRCTG